MFERVRDFFLNREWAMFVGIITTLVLSGEEFLEWISVLANENNDWSVVGILPLVAAAITRFRVTSNRTVEEIKDQLDKG